MKGYAVFLKMKFEIRKVQYTGLLQCAMDDKMLSHKLHLKQYLWVTWKYYKKKMKAMEGLIRLTKLKKISKMLTNVKKRIE